MQKTTYSIGIDVGGTHTDAVLVDDCTHGIIDFHKTLTTQPLEQGFTKALEGVLQNHQKKVAWLSGIFLGTTQAVNALIQGTDLFKVGVLRISSNCSEYLPSCYEWPEYVRKALYVGHILIDGGFECSGREIKNFNREQAKNAIEQLLERGMESLAVVGVFSPLNHEHERTVAQIAYQIAGRDFPISLSHMLGGIGFIERENTTILNAALKKSMQKGFAPLHNIMEKKNIHCPLFFTQNNGSLISVQDALSFPVRTISCGSTNSFHGAAKLAGVTNAVVVDIGGTSTDIGMILNDFVRQSTQCYELGGIRLNMPLPDTFTLGIGGGSHIFFDSTGNPSIGPHSCGKNLYKKGKAFGGAQLTLTDAAIGSNAIMLSKAKNTRFLSKEQARRIMAYTEEKIAYAVNKMTGFRNNISVILVGGGSLLFKKSAWGRSCIIPEYAMVANAYGAVLAEISGTIDTVVNLDKREKVLSQLQQKAQEIALRAGAQESSLRIVFQEIIPYSYIPENLARVKIDAAGKRN